MTAPLHRLLKSRFYVHIIHLGPIKAVLRETGQAKREARVREVQATLQQRDEEESRIRHETTQAPPTYLKTTSYVE